LTGVCTPKQAAVLGKASSELRRQQTARKIAAALKNPSALKSKTQSHLSHSKSAKPAGVRRYRLFLNIYIFWRVIIPEDF